MGIWIYQKLANPFDHGHTAHMLERRTCYYCKRLMTRPEKVKTLVNGDVATLRRCTTCGWWSIEETYLGSVHERAYGGFARLKDIDISDISTSIEEIREFLVAQFDKRNSIHPRLFEETVAAIMRDSGYRVRVTAYHKDNGIDIYLDGPDGQLVGIQVKRWKEAIKIEQIHALGGALLVNGCTAGVFVTTSRFQSGAVSNAKRFTDVTGIPIELIDATRLLSALEVSSSPTPLDAQDPDAPWNYIRRPYLWTS